MKLRHVTREELASLTLRERINAVIGTAKERGLVSGDVQDAFADQIGVARETVNRWVNGQIRPTRASRLKLSEYASELYGEEISPDLFRETVTGPTPLEEAASQLAQTGRAVEAALEALTQIAGHLVPLLERQEALVLEMQSFVAELRRQAAASEGAGGSH